MALQYQVLPKETVSMWTRDRVRLDADVYRPDSSADSFPILLMRQPYGRQIASTVVYAHPIWYAAHGFIVVIQDVRGRGTSQGEFRLFENEAADGVDTIHWVAQLPQSNGRVGMYGFSYQGMTQLFAAQNQPSALRALAPAMVGYQPYDDWAYENGALRLQAGLGWALQLAAETARRRGESAAFQALYQASRQLPIHQEITALPDVLSRFAPDSFWFDWLAHPQFDDYWQKITPNLNHTDLPMLHIGGWFDLYLSGDVRLYREMAARSQYPQPFWIGPWGHIPWGPKVGGRDFGPAANSPVDRLQISWFNHWLKDKLTSSLGHPGVTLFEMGSDRWQSFTTWPQGDWQHWYLMSHGLAATRQDDGRLVIPARKPEPLFEQSAIDTLVHDPWRSIPSIGGHAAIPSGPFERSGVDNRSDVLTYTSPPLAHTLKIAGNVSVSLQCQCDQPSFDLHITLSEVRPDGEVLPLTQGHGRFETVVSKWQNYQLTLQPTCFVCCHGHALRLSISMANFPAYTVNPGKPVEESQNRLIDADIITLNIRCNDVSTYLLLSEITNIAASTAGVDDLDMDTKVEN
ncbi:MAG: CocE/NonD family hydrolase [Leptolyngbyaceae cyanobacterium]